MSTIQNLTWPALVPTTTSKGTTYATSGTKLNPAVGAEDTTLFNESTTYNALNAALRGSGRNYRLGISYTWSKSLDESSSSNGGTNYVQLAHRSVPELHRPLQRSRPTSTSRRISSSTGSTPFADSSNRQ